MMRFSSMLVLMITLSISLKAQINDAQLWENIEVTKKFSKTWAFHFNHEGRIVNNFSEFHYAYGDFGIVRKFSKSLKMSLNYVLVWKKTDSHDSWRHQYYVSLTYNKDFLDHFNISLREEFQTQYQDIYSSELGKYPEHYLRSKATITYDPVYYPFYKIQPYIASEIYYHTDANDKYGPEFNRIRYFAGLFYHINKISDLELYYLYELHFNINNPPHNYVIGIGYGIKL